MELSGTKNIAMTKTQSPPSSLDKETPKQMMTVFKF